MFRDRPRRGKTAARRATLPIPERLEGRELLSYSPIGSLPDLVVTPQAGPIAAYKGQITVTLDVQNLGASSTVEPLNLEPGAPSTADAGPSQVGVFLLRTRHTRPGGPGSIRVGTVDVPGVPQNSLVRVTDTLTLPRRPRGFPGSSGRVFLGFRADTNFQTRDLDRTNNVSKVPLRIFSALPDLAAIAVDLPPVMQPGDVVAPSIKIANYGTADTELQAPVTVLLVASTDLNYGPNDVILARYSVRNVKALSQAPSRRVELGDVTLDDPPNVVTLEIQSSGGQNATLPASRASYNIGVVVDPLNEIRELNELVNGPNTRLQLVRRVHGVADLSPAEVLSDPAPPRNQFPTPAFAPLVTLTDFLADPASAAESLGADSGIPVARLTRARQRRASPPTRLPNGSHELT